MEETWKDFPSKKYGGNYLISSYGRVWNKKRQMLMKTPQSIGGPPRLTLSSGGTRKTFLVHRMVAKAFIGPIKDAIVTQIDGNKDNCYYENLEIKRRSGPKSVHIPSTTPIDSLDGRVISGYPDYLVTPKGMIYCLRKSCFSKLSNNEGCYQTVSLKNESGSKSHFVHRIVAEAFIPNPEEKPFVNHIDGIKSNNVVENLEWVTRTENELHWVDKLQGYEARRGGDDELARFVARNYAEDLKKAQREEITRIVITNLNKQLKAVYVKHISATSYKDQLRVAFGGKTITDEEAYRLAKEFVRQINVDPSIVVDKIASGEQPLQRS